MSTNFEEVYFSLYPASLSLASSTSGIPGSAPFHREKLRNGVTH